METQVKKFFIPERIYKSLEQRAKAEGKTPDECAEKLLLRAMSMDFTPASCPYCKKEIAIPRVGPPITHKAWRQLVKEDFYEAKRRKEI